MIIQNNLYKIEFSSETGKILSYSDGKQNFMHAENKPLLEVKLLNDAGDGIYIDSDSAQSFRTEQTENGCCFIFENMAEGVNGKVFLSYDESAFCTWSCEVENPTGYVMEWIGLPGIVVPDYLKGTGGDSTIFWPFGEGTLVENLKVRNRFEWLSYKEITGQSAGYNGAYPGPVAMQFMAYYNGKGGLYIGAEDAEAHLKTFEYAACDGGIRLETRIFTNGATERYTMPFVIKTGVFEGDWQEAAEIYRSWLETTDMLPEKIVNNKNLPEWYKDSPVIALYPIRGTKDNGDMTPNLYYPYANVLPFVDTYSEKFSARMMALPMHWEGTAPWAPPYVWPPYGGEEQFKAFADALHEKNHLLGVYCSGIGWTTHSYLDEVDLSDKYDEKFICKTPEGKIAPSKIIGPPIRDGHDMCPESAEVAQIVKGEVEALANAGCDYTQYFDQNLGGNSCLCYAKDHGHPAAPGKWQSDAMVRIFKTATENIDSRDMLIGCEAAAAESFLPYLPFNDLRNNIAFFFGVPVPAYAYVYHEYINNFMGNQNTIDRIMDLPANPDNLLFRIAYSFAAGDMLSVCLGKDGIIAWGWDVPWDTPAPDQESVCTLIGNLNPWRRGFAKKYLHTGRMIKAEKVGNIAPYRIDCADGRTLEFDDVLVTAFEAQSGEKAMVLTNYLGREKKVTFAGKRNIYTDAMDETKMVVGETVTIPPYSAVLAEMV